MPNVVKGSKQERMVVVPHRPLRRVLFTTAVLLGVLVSALGGWAYGYYKTMLSQETIQADRAELIADLQTAQTENADLKRQIAILDRASVMD
jgi:cell division protein FtsB